MKAIHLIWFLFPLQFLAVNYYCDPVNGSMANNGSISSPWGSLESVFNQGLTFSGGDKIILLNGNHGFPKIVGVNTSNVEIIPQAGHSPIINRIRIGGVSAASNWLLNGLLVESENVSQYPINLIDLYPNTSNITIINCTITSNQNTISWSRNDWRTKANNGIYSKGTGHKFNYNTIKNVAIGLSMLSDSSQFIGNTIQYFTIDGIRGLGNNCYYIGNSIMDNVSVYYYSENHYDGFQSYSSVPSVGNGIVSNVVIKQNTIINCTDTTRSFRGSMQGIGCFDGMYENWTIENNVIIVDNWHGITLAGATNCRIVNNTIIDPYDITYQDPNDPQQFGNIGPAWIRITAHKTDGGIYSGVPSTNNVVVNNLVPVMQNDNNIGLVSNNILLGASSNYSSYFIDYLAQDLHLIQGASAIDAGTATNAPSVDIEGTQRPQGNGIDVGAYEYTCGINFSIQASDTVICSGEQVTLTVATSATTINWNNNVQDNVPFVPLSTQTYAVIVSNGMCSVGDSVTVVVNPLPTVTIVDNNGILTVTGATGQIQWFLDNNLISGANASTYTYNSNGDYFVKVTDTSGCEGVSNTITVQGVGISEAKEERIIVYPNPVRNNVYIKSEGDAIIAVQLYDQAGKLIRQTKNTDTVDLKDVTSGVFFLKIITQEKSIVRKITVNKN